MKIIFAQVSYKDIYAEIGEPVYEPPLGILYIATFLRSKGFDSEVYDLTFDDQYKNFLKAVKTADFIGFTSTSPLFPQVLQLCKKIKKTNKEKKIILGGPHVSASPESVLKNDSIDYIITGEGEYATMNLLQGNLDFPGIGYKKNKKIIINPPELIKEINLLPFPDRSLLDINKYRVILPEGSGGRYTTIISSRGCPFRCSFCDSHITFGRKTRFRSPKNVVDEIAECVNKHNIKSFAFLDDTITLDKKRFIEIADRIINERLKIHYRCSTRVDCINEEVLSKMKESGCYRVHIGCESGDDTILKSTSKGITTRQIKKGVDLCKKIGLSTYAFFILGLPGETDETINKTIKFSNKLHPDFVQYTIATPFPGTDLHKYVIENNLMLKDLDYNSFKWYGNPVFKENIEPDDLINYQKYAYYKFYTNPYFLLKQIYSIRSYADIKTLFKGFWMLKNFVNR